jgi:hypothetical protein
MTAASDTGYATQAEQLERRIELLNERMRTLRNGFVCSQHKVVADVIRCDDDDGNSYFFCSSRNGKLDDRYDQS